MLDAELLKRLEAIVGRDRIKTSQEDLLTYSYDAYVKEYLPEAVLFPKSTGEVAGILQLANERGVPVTPRGSGTNLSGGSVPKKGGIILCFTMMNRLLEINRANRYAVVEPGLVVAEFQKEVEKIGLFYPPDPGSSAVATMGGTVLMNAGGMRGIKYG
ncbi:MAG: FAD-binding oxidoreductase, partial [Deltaproteobacteria bacterium]|nr:FAD-binding oxidoreductase [Deltaproteobacteria bacterium]